MRRAAVLALAAACLPAAALAQTPDSLVALPHDRAPVIRATRLGEPMRIDGILDEPAWQAAAGAGGFIQNDPHEGASASESTKVRVLIDDDAIYFGLRMHDREPQLIRSALARRDESLESDLVELFLDTFHDHQTAYNFRITPAGAIRDGALGADGSVDNSWDAVWESAARIDELGWVAELRIPLSQLRYNAVDESVWGIQVARLIQRKAEVSVFSFTPKREQGGVFRYGHLVGLGRLTSRRRLELVPYASARSEFKRVASGNPFRDGSDSYAAAGLDLKYGVTPDATLDATINPDFGQVEVDPAVVNLSAFETFFPEKRPFFVEGAELFRFGRTRSYNTMGQATMFHSRRIGREPQRDLFGPDYQYVDAPTQTSILGAVRVSGKTANGWSITALDALTDRELADYVDLADTPQLATVEPRTNYFVGRARRAIDRGNTTVGALVTATHRDLLAPELTDMLRARALLGGVDFSHYWGQRRWLVDGFVAGSHVNGSPSAMTLTQESSARYFQRPDAESFSLDPTRTALGGYAADLSLIKASGLHWLGSVSLQTTSPGFEVNDLGFQNEADRRSFSALALYQETRPGRLFRNYDLFAFTNHSWNADGDQTVAQFAFTAGGTFSNYWWANGRIESRPRFVDDRLTRGGPVMLLPSGGTVRLNVGSDTRRRTTFGISGSTTWDVAGGWGVSFQPWVAARPATPLLVAFEPSFSRSHSQAFYLAAPLDPLATATYGSRYVFSDLDQVELSLATRVNWAFTPKLSLQLYLQPLISTGDGSEYKELIAPRSFEFAVYGRDIGSITASDDLYLIDPDAAGPAPPFFIGNPDFNFRSLIGNAVLRWEYRPGSALFFVWQQRRLGLESIGDFSFGRDHPAVYDQPPENVYAIKATWWIGE